MKKRILNYVIVLVIIATAMLTFTACGKTRKAITALEFEMEMEERGFAIYDVSANVAADAGEEALKTAIIAMNDSYQIDFYVLHSVEEAKGLFELNKSIFEEGKTGTATDEVSISEKNYNVYGVVDGDNYHYISYTDDTMILFTVASTYADEVKEIITELGY